MSTNDFRAASRQNWGHNSTVEHVNAGSLQRIADATEKMAMSYGQMRNSRDFYMQTSERLQAEVDRLIRQRTALRAAVARMKKARSAIARATMETQS